MSIRERIKGSIPALITPMKDGAVDEAAVQLGQLSSHTGLSGWMGVPERILSLVGQVGRERCVPPLINTVITCLAISPAFALLNKKSCILAFLIRC